MMTFSETRKIAIGCALAASVAIVEFKLNMRESLQDYTLQTGLLLLGIVFVLVLLNIRKKLSYLPLGKVSRWLKVHIYLAWFSMAVFAVHVDFRWPDGGLESVVAALYCLAAISGVVGAWLSKAMPVRLTSEGGSIVYETISFKRKMVREAAEKLAMESIEETQKHTISDFYAEKLSPFFFGTYDYVSHLLNSNRSLMVIYNNCDNLKRYLNAREIEIIDELKGLVEEKYVLDEHYSLLNLMKYWLFVHVPLSYSLLAFAVVHGLLALKMSGAL